MIRFSWEMWPSCTGDITAPWGVLGSSTLGRSGEVCSSSSSRVGVFSRSSSGSGIWIGVVLELVDGRVFVVEVRVFVRGWKKARIEDCFELFIVFDGRATKRNGIEIRSCLGQQQKTLIFVCLISEYNQIVDLHSSWKCGNRQAAERPPPS